MRASGRQVPPVSTTVAPVGDPDRATAAFLVGIELAAAAVHAAAVATGKLLEPAAANLLNACAAHHRAHGQALAGYATLAGPPAANTVLAGQFAPQVAAAPDQGPLLRIIYGLEQRMGATELAAIETLQDPAALRLVASILPVEAQHAALLANLLGLVPGTGGPADDPALLTTAAAFHPEQYPT
ncbi:MAG: ferritin-like domain-containing protein, partial [Acidimicrobiales bacterium]